MCIAISASELLSEPIPRKPSGSSYVFLARSISNAKLWFVRFLAGYEPLIAFVYLYMMYGTVFFT